MRFLRSLEGTRARAAPPLRGRAPPISGAEGEGARSGRATLTGTAPGVEISPGRRGSFRFGMFFTTKYRRRKTRLTGGFRRWPLGHFSLFSDL